MPAILSRKARHMHWLRPVAAACVTWIIAGSAAAGSDDRAGLELFEKRIRPVLIQSCYKCHSGQSPKLRGGLRLDSRAHLRKGGETGPAVVPGKPEQSLLLEALRYESLKMPPTNKLPATVIADFTKWIAAGAPDPRDTAEPVAADVEWPTILNSRRDWWSLQSVVAADPPHIDVKLPIRDVDRFVLARQRAAGVAAAKPADPTTLLRRLTLVLTGLPPSRAQAARYLPAARQDPEAAYAALVDRLLSSPHFGERWARHWMDVVRYTETHGNEWNYEVHHAWRYRDYLIRAFNSDVPYDQLVREHIAGDLLGQPRWNHELQINESVIGTSFYRFGEVNHDDCVELTSIGYDILDNQIDTLSKAFQATTAACARCHHHKIDAISMYDYYALLGMLKSSRLTAHTIDSPQVNAASLKRLQALKTRIRRRMAEHWKSQAGDLARYLLAADAGNRKSPQAAKLSQGLSTPRLQRWTEALQVEKPGMQHPLYGWLRSADAQNLATAWAELQRKYAEKHAAQSQADDQQFQSLGDFRHGMEPTWTFSGQGLRSGRSRSGAFTVTQSGDNVIQSILPAGLYTHTASQKLNGTLRSPVLTTDAKHVSFQVVGEHTSAVRLISNNCQLNYANYRALTSAQPTWVTFPIPTNARDLYTFAELVTKFDNPKFPDQLGTLGGDSRNDRVPWSEAATDPHSYFGITRAVLHDGPSPPEPDLSPLAGLYGPEFAPASLSDVARRYEELVASAISAWAANQATDADVFWLSWIVTAGLLDHSKTAAPELDALITEYRQIENHGLQRPRLSAGVADFGAGRDHPIFENGDHSTPGPTVPRRYLEVLSRPGQQTPRGGSGRLQLAHQIASPHNPLTARVLVNRVWHHLFGTGIVRTVDDFGRAGELPSHPQLLDYLANRFVASDQMSPTGWNWSVRSLIREIVLSRTFRMSSRADDRARAVDPGNRLLHHFPARRMEAEAIRDSILSVSGRLQTQLYGLSVQPYREQPNTDRRLFAGPLDGDGRRSVYIKINLMEGPRFLSAFNFPGGKIAQGRRDVTNVPSQALTLLNDRFVVQQAGVWSDRVLSRTDDDIAIRINHMLQSAVGRTPTPDETDRFVGLVSRLAKLHTVADVDVLSSHVIWKDVAHVMLNLKEFIYIP